ncbi:MULTISPECIES: ACP S-malonyltransferase [unclassified Streptomyces]|uniref:ACP S-malonyltransferase n=1 Tax=unclassified Streptomyces TaxID=2593676 RepID=UPI002E2C6961|nr:ACP S-malonyltransferase [Streptomyces sp. NBC_01439]
MTSGLRAETAIVFPGMGASTFSEVGKFMLINPAARRLTARADEVLGYSLIDRFRDDEDDYSEAAQVAFMVNCLASADWAERTLGLVPEVCTGPSFGEKVLSAYSGALSFEDAVRMTAGVARCMADYFTTDHQDVVTHSFLRTPQDRLQQIFAEFEERGEFHEVSCYIDHDFHMVSMREHSLEWFRPRLRELGGMSLYTMRPPVHCSAFGSLRARAESEVFSSLTFHDPRLPVVADQDGTVLTTADEIRTMLLDSFVTPMRWPAVVASLRTLGVTKACVSGPDALFGRVPLTRNSFEVVPASPAVAMRPRSRSKAAA